MRSIKSYYVANNYMLKVNKRKTNIDCEMFSELTISFEIIEVVLVYSSMACNGVLTSPPSPSTRLPPSPKFFNPLLVLKSFIPPINLKQTRCESNAQTSYPT